jgi:site-specific recombinase XerD
MKRQRGVFEKEKGSGEWWINYYIKGVQRREKAGRHADACALYHKRKAEALRAQKLPELADAGKFGELVAAARKYSEEEWPRSYRSTSYRLKAIEKHFGADTVASKVDKYGIEKFLQGMQTAGKQPASINRMRSALSLTFRLAVESGKLVANPVKAVRRRKENNERDRYLNESEESRLRAVMAKHYPHRVPELDIALHTGLRQSSQYELRWEDVDLEIGQVRIRRAKPGEKQFVRLNSVALAAFKAIRWGRIAELRATLSRRTGTPQAFPVDPGNVFDLRSPRQWFERALALAGISNFTWHDLRHTAASRATMAGVPLRAVQDFLGHKNITTTQRYAHLSPDFQQQAADSLLSYDRRARRLAHAEPTPRTHIVPQIPERGPRPNPSLHRHQNRHQQKQISVSY